MFENKKERNFANIGDVQLASGVVLHGIPDQMYDNQQVRDEEECIQETRFTSIVMYEQMRFGLTMCRK